MIDYTKPGRKVENYFRNNWKYSFLNYTNEPKMFPEEFIEIRSKKDRNRIATLEVDVFVRKGVGVGRPLELSLTVIDLINEMEEKGILDIIGEGEIHEKTCREYNYENYYVLNLKWILNI